VDLTLEITRILPSTRSRVFRFFTEADRLARWWGPEGFSIPSLSFDPRSGASFRIEMQPPGGEPFYLAGEFREVDPPTRLSFTFRWEEPDPDDVETVADLSFRDLGTDTEVALSQGPFKTRARYELHLGGWSDSFAKLETVLRDG
jgi:uncharacterized protein YndB with AHSA1/START domain